MRKSVQKRVAGVARCLALLAAAGQLWPTAFGRVILQGSVGTGDPYRHDLRVADNEFAGAAAAGTPPAPRLTAPAGQMTPGDFGAVPLAFVPNAGQADPRVRFSARAVGANFYFTPGEAVLTFTRGKRGHALRLSFVGANRAAYPSGARPGAGKVNYLVGGDAARWRTRLPAYEEVVYRDLWPGIDLAFRGDGGALKYEFRLEPGADPGKIRLAYRGADRLSLGGEGDLLVHTPLGVLSDSRPVSYQEVAGRRVPVASRYELASGGYGFAIGDYDRARPLVIDPSLDYSTYLGGGGSEQALDIALDAAGNAYVTGSVFRSPEFPVSAGAFDPTPGSFTDAFVTKLSPSGGLVYSTYLGGTGGAVTGSGIAVDAAGSAYVTGTTLSSDFPVTPDTFDTSYNGNGDAFVTKLDPSGTALVYSTFLGSSGGENPGLGAVAFDIAVDGEGSAYLTGIAGTLDFPTTPGAFDTTGNGFSDVFVTKLNPAGSALVYSTYLGGSGNNWGNAIAVDAAGSAYVTGLTDSRNFPVTTGAFDTTLGDTRDAFVTKLNPSGSALAYSTFLGGALSIDQGNGIAVDAQGHAYVTGTTASVDFPTTQCAFDRSKGGGQDAFVTKLNPAGTALVYSTFLGGTAPGVGSPFEDGFGIAVDAAGSAYVTGNTNSADFPVTPDAFDPTYGGSLDAFVAKLDAAGSSLVHSTFLGGGGGDQAFDIALDDQGGAYVTGATGSSNFPTAGGAFDTSQGGDGDGFVSKLSTPPASATPTSVVLTPASATGSAGTTHTLTATVLDAAGNPLPGITVGFTVSGSVTNSGSCVTGAEGRCPFTYLGPAAPGVDTIRAFADADGDGAADTCEPSGTATQTWVAVGPTTLVVNPPEDVSEVGTERCVRATLEGPPSYAIPGVTIYFTVAGSVSAGGAFITDLVGGATFCYFGPDLPGADIITAHADMDADGLPDPGEPVATATKTWVLPATPTGQLTGGGHVPASDGRSEVAFGFNVRADEGGSKGACDVIDRAAGVRVKCLSVTSFARAGAQATFLGDATVNGVITTYRIEVDDLAEPGAGRDQFRIVTGGGYAAGGVLTGGNIQVR